MFLYFNPLHHEGGDLCYDDGIKMCLISIHSTTRVETKTTLAAILAKVISIHSTTRVETRKTA